MINWKYGWKSFLNEDTSADKYPFPADMTRDQYAIGAFIGLSEAHRSHADSVSKQVAGDIVKHLKTELHIDDDDPTPFFEEYFVPGVELTGGVEFSVSIAKTAIGRPFSIDSGVYAGDVPLIDIRMVFDTRYPIVNYLEDIYFKLLEDVRHELEHVINQKGGEPANSVFDHYIDKGEVPSMVRGLHLRAKKMKIPTEDMFHKELEQYVQTGELSPEESEQVFQTWKQELDKIQAKGK